MKDVYTSAIGFLSDRARPWVLPSVVAVGFFAYGVFPSLAGIGVFRAVATWSSGEQFLLSAFTALVLAVVASTATRIVLRILEGYRWWPEWIRQKRTQAHELKRTELRSKISDSDVELGFLAEAIRRYPSDPQSMMPTSLGNILRAAEEYGTDRYGLDTVSMWHRLVVAASSDMRSQLGGSRYALDQWVAAIVVAGVLGVASAITAIWSGATLPIFVSFGAWLSVPLWYSFAVGAAASYAQSLRALVDTSRRSLAELLDLRLPRSHDDEVRMWTAVSGMAAWGPGLPKEPEWQSRIDKNKRTD